MNGPVSLKFFVVGGVILILTGVLQAFVRPRRPGELGLGRYLNRGSIWAVFCVAIGVLAILVGLGLVPVASR